MSQPLYKMTILTTTRFCLFLFANAYVNAFLFSRHPHHYQNNYIKTNPIILYETSSATNLQETCNNLNTALEDCSKEMTRTCNIKVGISATARLGLIATSDIKKGDLILNIPHDEQWEVTRNTAKNIVFQDVLEEEYDGWTGDTGLLALQLLNEIARTSGKGGIDLPKRSLPIQEFMSTWIMALPTPTEMDHPLLWSEEDQEILQSSSNTKIYRILDDIEEDITWLNENIFERDRTKFPEYVELGNNDQKVPCFNLEGYKWSMALIQSRSIFVDGCIRLLPLLDLCNHNDDAKEIQGGTMGAFGTTKGCELVASQTYKAGEEVFCSYGPKSAAEYLLEHGFCPPSCWKTCVSEITLELDPEDRFYDDKLDILEYETYDSAPMDPIQSFDVVSAPGRDGEPDPAMIQFARLQKLGGLDAFLLESIFRKEVWGFMALPVSESNELAVVETISEVCESALEDLNQCPEGGPELCTKLRESESKALKRTMEFMLREKEALDLKEYYQERRLKDLGLDSEWTPEDDMVDPDLSFGQTRAPGSNDFDW